MRWLRFLVAAGCALPIALIAAFLWFPAIGSPSSEALQASLTREVDGAGIGIGIFDCVPRGRSVRVCTVSDAHGSGAAEYRMHVDGRRCWRARKISPDRAEEGPPPYLDRDASGCVRLRDQLRARL
jgi:hypothetical protein